MKPTIVLVHGAFAESASWNKVVDSLAGAGHPVIAAPNPLRSPTADAAAVGDLLRTVDGPVVLGGHFIAERAGARRALEIPGASHAAAVSHPEETAELILQAAALPAAA